MATDRCDMNMKRALRIICATSLCVAVVAAAVGCGTSPKRHISFNKRHSRHSNSRYVVRGQSHKQAPDAHKDMFVWPLDTFVFMSPFGIRRGRRHDGVDLSAKGGTPVKASADGEVVYAKRMRGYGNLILIKHDHDYFTAYAHNRRNLVGKGTKVKRGQKIALVGRTGRATGNHVHFEIRKGQRAMDPLGFLPARAGVLVKKKGAAKKATVAAKSTSRKRKSSVTVRQSSKKKAAVAAKTGTKKKAAVATKSTTKKKTVVAQKSKVSTKKKAVVTKKATTKKNTTVATKTANKAQVKDTSQATVATKSVAPKAAAKKPMTTKAAKIKDSVAQVQRKPASAPKTTVAKSSKISSKKAPPAKKQQQAVKKKAKPKLAKKSGKAMSNK